MEKNCHLISVTNFLPETEQEYKFFKGNLGLSFFWSFTYLLSLYFCSSQR